MASHGASYLLVLMVSLLVAVVALSGAEARLTAHPDDANGGMQLHADAPGQKVDPTCSDCDPKPPQPAPEPPCSNCVAPVPALTCNKLHWVKAGETCESIAQCADLDHDKFVSFNPNLECCKLFAGQWVCLEATPACA